MSIPYFYVYKDSVQQWRWTFTAANSKKLAVSSESYVNLLDCEHSINLIKTTSGNAPVIGDDSFKRLRN